MKVTRVTVRHHDGQIVNLSKNPKVFLTTRSATDFANMWNLWTDRYVEIEEGEITWGPPVRR